jgi:F-type H+-transporting ATPase subunit alpha
LKQPNGQPVAFFKQAAVIYAGINGYLDSLDFTKIKLFESSLYDKLDTTYDEFAGRMIEKKELSSEIEDTLKILIEEVIKEVS